MTNATPVDWLRDFGRPPRIMGLDVARALAILGMIGAHLGETAESFDIADPGSWSSVVHGHPSVLFAVLAGVSVALMTGRAAGPDPQQLPALRLSLVGRGATIFMIGLLLEVLNTPIAVILTLYGVLYIALIPVLRLRAWQLLTIAGGLALAGPALVAVLSILTLGPSGQGIGFALHDAYPITVWLAYALAGMALGRIGIAKAGAAWRMLAAGAVVAVAGHLLGALGRTLSIPRADGAWTIYGPPSPDGFAGGGWDGYFDQVVALDPGGAIVRALLSVAPHSGGTADILAAGGVAVAVTAACVLLAQPLRPVLLPFAALGSMPLSAYTAHVISYAVMAGPAGFISSNGVWLASAVMLLAVTTLWSATYGRGPLERLAAWVARIAASVPAPRPTLPAR